MERLKWPDDEAIEAKMVTRAVENAQKQIEELNYERRKNVLKYDEVMNPQREVIYGERRKILEGYDLASRRWRWSRTSCAATVAAVLPAGRVPGGVGPRRAVHRARRGLPGARSTKDELGRRRRRRSELAGAVRRGRAGRVRGEGGARVGAPMHARARARRPAEHHRHEVARAPLRDGLPAGGHPPAGATRRRTRSRSTSARPSTCSRS